MRFKIDWANLIVRSKFTVFALFYFISEGNFPSTSPRGAYIWKGDLTVGFLRYRFVGLIFGGTYFRNFTVPPQFEVLAYIPNLSLEYFVKFHYYLQNCKIKHDTTKT